MQPDCSDICEIIHIQLTELGFKISDSNEDHTDMIKALSGCRLVREDTGPFIVLNWNSIPDLSVLTDPESQEPLTFETKERAEAKAKELCAWEWKVVAI